MSTSEKEQPMRGSLRLADKGERAEQEQPKPALPRQFVTFTFYHARPDWRLLDAETKAAGKREFIETVEQFRKELLIHSYSITGLRSNVDFMLWRIGYDLDPLQEMSARLNNTGLGRYLEVSQSFLSMTKRSMYIDKDNPEHVEDRLHVVPGKSKYLFVYPFVKTRAWYMLPVEERQEMMDVHIRVGSKYRSVKLHTTYSFGLDDQEFVVAFESDSPSDFLDLVMELRETKSSEFTLRDTPIFTCIAMTAGDALDTLAAAPAAVGAPS
ncbi:MAG TPA: chlorite dismutase family protein [Pyrinomonadaceae bacterium]|nr:chlorite dismutase family protein [Pyrinomonadaceae bacterium]